MRKTSPQGPVQKLLTRSIQYCPSNQASSHPHARSFWASLPALKTTCASESNHARRKRFPTDRLRHRDSSIHLFVSASANRPPHLTHWAVAQTVAPACFEIGRAQLPSSHHSTEREAHLRFGHCWRSRLS